MKKPGIIGSQQYAREVCKISVSQILLAQAEHLTDETNPQHGAAGNIGIDDGAALEKAKSTKDDDGALTTHDTTTSSSVVDTLAEVLQVFIEQMGRMSVSYANLTGRNSVNLNDVVLAISDASTVTNSSLRELALYSMYEEVPFPRKLHPYEKISLSAAGINSVPGRLPLYQPSQAIKAARQQQKDALTERLRKAMMEEAQQHEDYASTFYREDPNQPGGAVLFGEGPHIEPWMPPLPPPHSYIHTPIFPGTAEKFSTSKRPMVDPSVLSMQRRQLEMSFVNLASGAKRLKTLGVEENPYWVPPRIVDLEKVPEAGRREALEPVDQAQTSVVELLDVRQRPEGEADPKKVQAERILAESAGIHE